MIKVISVIFIDFDTSLCFWVQRSLTFKADIHFPLATGSIRSNVNFVGLKRRSQSKKFDTHIFVALVNSTTRIVVKRCFGKLL
jgi:hypothetical protein